MTKPDKTITLLAALTGSAAEATRDFLNTTNGKVAQ
jgi:hypothetical protein